MVSIAVPFVSTFIAFIAISIVIFAHNFLSANYDGCITDLFPDSVVSRATGLTGVASGLSGQLFPPLTGFFVDRISYKPVFALAAMMPLAGTIVLFVMARKHRFNEPSHAALSA